MKPPPFEYVAAESVEEALAALAAGGADATPIAGGQSLVPALNMRLVRPSLLVDLGRTGLDHVVPENGSVRIGATVRQATLLRTADRLPLLAQALPFVGHAATRNRGTIGGSIAHADGAAELPLCLVALGGAVVAEGPGGRREIDAEGFFVTHYLTTLDPGELVVETVWPAARPGEGFGFEELALRAGDFALAMVAAALRREDGVARDVRVAVGGVTDRPTVAREAAAELEGAPVDAALARAAGAAAAAAVDPPASMHASPDYLRRITAVLTARAVERAWAGAA